MLKNYIYSRANFQNCKLHMTTEKDRECEMRVSIQTKVGRILMLVKLTKIAARSVSLVPGIAGASIGTSGIVTGGIGITVMRFIGTFVDICIKN